MTGLLLGAFAGCSGDAPRSEDATAEESPSPERSPGPDPSGSRARLVTLHVSGGYAGVDKEIAVRTDGSYTTSLRDIPGRTGRFTPAELSRLRRLLDGARLGTQPSRNVDPDLRDQFLYRVTYGDHVVVTDLSDPVPPLSDAIALLERALDRAVED
ncbi:hypothetical protein DVA86_01225 [Streptomyces armeniacus]|uniref:Uncharacterized protein n=2 Tax=Streptomyces armeniacus TaxID=83291 RepID=A0A345XIK5_9ACTN|nr:hypothetical protein DVA86_01225 [Streptomyces armeniacus]